MKTRMLFWLAGIAVLASCSRNTDLFVPDTPDTPATNTVTNEEIQANVKKVFGVTFDANHDWSTTVSGEVTIHANASVKNVQLLVNVVDLDDSESEYFITSNVMRVLNEAQTNGQSTITLKYDAPKDNRGLFVAFATDNGFYVKKVVNNTVSYDGGANARMTRALPAGYVLPTGEFAIGEEIESYAAQRNWIPGEKLYGLSDYSAQKMDTPDYSDDFKELFRGIVFSYFPNGRSYNNLPKVKASGYYNEKVYPITTGEDPIIITPMYKRDSAKKYGNEVWNSDLYYYYFKDEDLNAAADPVAFLEALPKYKVIPFNECFGEEEDDEIRNHGSYALLYFGDGTPSVGTVGTYQFPKGYKIGFMVRAKTTADNKQKQGEVYGDGRLNHNINSFGNFKSSKLGSDDPRVAWLTLNDKLLMCWESGTDSDFNDIILSAEGGIEPFVSIPDLDPEVYTYCFEDTELGDYDLNDIVVKAIRVNATTIQYSIVACGGWDELFVRNINSGVITDDAEVHALFGKEPKQFINTDGGEYCSPVAVLKTVDKNFSFLDKASQPYIYDKTTNTTVRLAEVGEDPHGIMIAGDFEYPIEKICVKDAYEQFNSWGQNPINSVTWYTTPVTSRIYRK